MSSKKNSIFQTKNISIRRERYDIDQHGFTSCSF